MNIFAARPQPFGAMTTMPGFSTPFAAGAPMNPMMQDSMMSSMMMLVMAQMMMLMGQILGQNGGGFPLMGGPAQFGMAGAATPPPLGGNPLGDFLGNGSAGPGGSYGGYNNVPDGGLSNSRSSGTSSSRNAADLGSVRTDSRTASRLLQSIRNNPVPPGCSPGYCYRGVKHHLRQIGVNLTGGSAYQAADQLANNPRFREVRVGRDQLRSLPAGAVVVWDRDPSNRTSGGKRHGHISISTGDGREASDKLRNQMTGYGPRFRVFLPVDNGAQRS